MRVKSANVDLIENGCGGIQNGRAVIQNRRGGHAILGAGPRHRGHDGGTHGREEPIRAATRSASTHAGGSGRFKSENDGPARRRAHREPLPWGAARSRALQPTRAGAVSRA